MTRPARYLGILLTLSALTCAAQTTCSRTGQQAAIAKTLKLRRSLLGTSVVWMGMPFPGASYEQYEPFKNALLRVADTTMACEPAASSAATIQQQLARVLHANRPQPPTPVSDGEDNKPEKNVITANLRVRVKEALSSPHLITINFQFGRACGNDNILIVFEQTGTGWKDVLRWRAKDFRETGEVDTAFSDFFNYAVLPGTGGDSWRVVALHGAGGCTSTISDFTTNLLAASGDPNSTTVLSSSDREYRRGDEDWATKFSSEGNAFTFRAVVDTGETETMVRKAVFRYQLEGDHLRRLPPIATTGAFFVNEWLQMPWQEAGNFIDTHAAESLKAMHERYTSKSQQTKPYVSYTFGPVHQCSGIAKRFQVQINETPENGTKVPLYFSILENGTGYTLLSASTHPDAQCKGPDLMTKPR